MKILLYGLNYAPEMTGIGKYSGQLGAWLNTKGHQVKVVTAPPYYPSWKISEGYKNWFKRETVEGVDVYRCPLYVPEQPTTFSRLLHLCSFVASSTWSLITLIRWRPKIVINVVPSLFSSFPAWLYCRITGAKFLIHVQDFESDAMFSLSDNGNESVTKKIWSKIEKFILSRADAISTISNAMMDNAISKGVDASKVLLFPNWSEVSLFQNVQNTDEFKSSLLGDREEKIILYSGNVGRKQGLELVIECAKISSTNDDQNLYVICGDGAGKKDLIELTKKLNLTNVVFLPLQPYSDLPKLLAMADVHLVIQKPDVANAVLPSKLTNIFSVGGHAVITTHDDTEIGRLIKKFPGIAIPVKPEDCKALLLGIELASKEQKINNVAKNYAQTYLAKESVLNDFEENFKEIISA